MSFKELQQGALKQIRKAQVQQEQIDTLRNYDWGYPTRPDEESKDDFLNYGWIYDFNLDMVLSEAIITGASDVHITPNQQVAFTVNGDILKQDRFGIINNLIVSSMENCLLTNVANAEYAQKREFDFQYTIRKGPYRSRRTRVNIGRTFGENFFVFRIISENIPSIDSLGISKEMQEWFTTDKGLVLVCGSTGTGKSTTLASLVRDVQLNAPKKIITIESPIEYIYPDDGQALIVQREVGIDSLTFGSGLAACMRESPDIILLGEIRKRDEVDALIQAADSGHLAISTMHTSSFGATINRILSLFPGEEQSRILSTLADSLQGVCNQVLVKDKLGGRVACREEVTMNGKLRDLVVKGDIQGINKYVHDHKLSTNFALAKAVARGICSYEEAKTKSSNRKELYDIIQKM